MMSEHLNSQQEAALAQLWPQHQDQQQYDLHPVNLAENRQGNHSHSVEESNHTAHFSQHNSHLQQQSRQFQSVHLTSNNEDVMSAHAALTPQTVSDHTLSANPTTKHLFEHGQEDEADGAKYGQPRNRNDNDMAAGTANYQEIMAANKPSSQSYNNDNELNRPISTYNPSQIYAAADAYDGVSQESPESQDYHQQEAQQMQPYQENRTQFAPRQMRPDSNNYSRPATTDHYDVHTNQHGSTTVESWQHRSEETENNRAVPTRFLSAKTNVPPQQLQVHTQGSQSSLMRQFSDKIKTQAERLQKLENYKKLCERRILDFEPNHALPITEDMLGQGAEATRDYQGNRDQAANLQDLKKQLALKEQDLLYAKQRAEKTVKENEYLRKELAETQTKLRTLEQQHQNSPEQRGATENGIGLQAAQLTQKQLREQLKTLEEEKNALLDYIEESVNMTQNASVLQHNSFTDGGDKGGDAHRMTINDLQNQINSLTSQRNQLNRQNEELMKRVATFEKSGKQVTGFNNQSNLGTNQEETFDIRNLPTGLSARSPSGANQPIKCESQGVLSIGTNQRHNVLSQGSLPQVQSIDYMVLDLNAVKQELMETQNQFNSTQECLEKERKEKQDLQDQLQEAQSRIVDLEQLQMQQTQQTAISNNTGPLHLNTKLSNPWHPTISQEAPDTEYKVKLVEERDRLLDQKSELQDRIQALREENDMLKVTLDQTQSELENLVENHERITRQVQDLQGQLREAQDLPRRLRQEAQGISDKLEEKNAEVKMLQDEIKSMSVQAESDMDTLKQLKACNLRLEGQLVELRDADETKIKTQTKQWEATIDDLTRDLHDAKARIVEKDTIYQKVERELRLKLHEVEDAHTAKSTLLRRIEDLNHEVRQLQAVAERKESETKEQQRQIEHLQFENERLTVQLQKASHEKNATQEMRKEDMGVLEAMQQKVDKQSKVINKICRDIGKVQELVNSISKEFQLTNGIKLESAVPTQDVSSARRANSNNHLDEQLREANSFLKQTGEWLVAFAKTYKHAMKTIDMRQSEIDHANQQIKMLEGRYQTTQQDEFEAREHGKQLTTELQNLKAEIAETQTLQKDGYEREERIHKKNQQLKTQIEGIKIQKEKLQLQIKTLLGDKELLKDTLEQKTAEVEDESERSKRLELQLSQVIEQKQSMLELFTRFKDAFPSDSLRSVFDQIIDVVKMGHELDQKFSDTEKELLNREGQLRKYAKREVEGLLSTKVINIRKEVEQGRQQLRVMTQERQELDERLSELELELKQNETIERRRTDVALETETALVQVRNELQDARKELIFIQRNRNDLEVALKAQQQEREMVQRELLTLRHQLQLKADLNPDNYKSAASTARKLTSYNATQSSVQTNNPTPNRPFSADRMNRPSNVALRHGQLEQPHIHIEQRPDASELPVRRRFPSQEPAIYTQQPNENNQNLMINSGELLGNPRGVQPHHAANYSDMPLQMPSLSDRMGEKMRPSMYGGVMSGAGAQATTAAVSYIDANKPPTARQHNQQQQHQVLSSRPPTYQSTQSGSKKSLQNTNSFNPMPQTRDQYATGNFPTIQQPEHYQDSHSVHTLRQTIQGTRSNSMSNLHANPHTRSNGNLNPYYASGYAHPHHNSSQVPSGGDQLQPIMSQYGGEITSRSGQPSPGKERYPALIDRPTDRSRESPLRSSTQQHVQDANANANMPRQLEESQKPGVSTAERQLQDSSLLVDNDSKLDANAYLMNHMSTQKSHSAYGAHRSSINESSIHNKLSALRNVFSQIRQNLDESSMTGTRTHQHSSVDQSLIQNHDYC